MSSDSILEIMSPHEIHLVEAVSLSLCSKHSLSYETDKQAMSKGDRTQHTRNKTASDYCK